MNDNVQVQYGQDKLISPSRIDWAEFIFVFALASVFRALPYDVVFSTEGIYDGSLMFFEGDCYQRMRKILLHIREFPYFVTYDYFDGYPVGTPAIKSPMLDYVLSAVSVFLGRGSPDIALAERVAAWSPVFVGGLSACVIYVLGTMVFSRAAGFLAAIALALMTAHLEFTLLGRPDNEMLEPLLVLLMIGSYLLLQRQTESGLKRVTLFALASIILLLFWRGATLWIMLAALAIFVDITVDAIGTRSGKEKIPGKGVCVVDRHKRGAAAFAMMAVFFAAFCMLDVWGTQNSFRFNIISWFHVSLFIVASICILIYGEILTKISGEGRGGVIIKLSYIVVAGTLGITLTLVAIPSLRDNIVAGMGIVGMGATDPWIENIMEYRPFFDNKTVRDLPLMFGWGFLLVPLALPVFCIDSYKRGLDRGRLLIVIFAVSSIALTLARTRFMNIMTVLMALCIGYVLYETYQILAGRIGLKPQLKRPVGTALGIVVIAAMFYPIVPVARYIMHNAIGQDVRGEVAEGMSWIRHNTPMATDPYDLSVKPGYAVMAQWDESGWIEYLAERPAVATLYGRETFGLGESADFFLSVDNSEATTILDKTGARFVLLKEMSSSVASLASIQGVDSREFIREVSFGSGMPVTMPTIKFFELVSSRLFFADGIDLPTKNIHFKEVDGFRLVYESAESNVLPWLPIENKKLKVFEYVRGASIVITSVPNDQIRISSIGMSNRGRIFKFNRALRADDEGRAMVNLTYSQSSDTNKVRLVVPYTIYSGSGTSKSLALSEADVVSGTLKSIDLR